MNQMESVRARIEAREACLSLGVSTHARRRVGSGGVSVSAETLR
jgi:hypothetical protein